MPLADTLEEQRKRVEQAASKKAATPTFVPKSSFQPSTAAPSSKWVWPTTSTRVTQSPSGQHEAIDIGGKAGSPVFSPTAGTVQDIKYQPQGYGLNVRITTKEGYTIVLGHLMATVSGLFKGETVTAGQQVGLLGSTGHSTGPHLHFEVREPGYTADRFVPGSGSAIGAIDPYQFLKGAVVPSTTPAKQSTSSFVYAPATIPEGVPSTVAVGKGTKQGEVLASKSLATSAQASTSTGAKQKSETSTKAASSQASTPGGIKIASTPIGDVTIPQPGVEFTKWLLIGIGVILVLVGLFVLVNRARRKTGEVTRGALSAQYGAQVKVAEELPGGRTVVRYARKAGVAK